jgi:HSP20 family protein
VDRARQGSLAHEAPSHVAAFGDRFTRTEEFLGQTLGVQPFRVIRAAPSNLSHFCLRHLLDNGRAWGYFTSDAGDHRDPVIQARPVRAPDRQRGGMPFMSTTTGPILQLPNELQRLFDDAFGQRRAARSEWSPTGEGRESEWSPVADIHETDAELTFTVELPGIAPDQVRVTAEKNVLTIDGARSPGHLGKTDGSYHLRERHNGPFACRFHLPRGVDPTLISSEYADGILDVHVPKAALSQPTVIPVTIATDRTRPAKDAMPLVAVGLVPPVPDRSNDTNDSTVPAGATG